VTFEDNAARGRWRRPLLDQFDVDGAASRFSHNHKPVSGAGAAEVFNHV